MKDPKASLQTPLTSLLENLKTLKQLEKEKLVKEVKAYATQYNIRSIWESFRSLCTGSPSLSQLKEQKELKQADLFHLNDVYENQQKLAIVPFQTDQPAEEDKRLQIDETHFFLRLPDELLQMIISLSDNPRALAYVNFRLRTLTQDPRLRPIFLQNLSNSIGIPRSVLEEVLLRFVEEKKTFSFIHQTQIEQAKLQGIALPERYGMCKLQSLIQASHRNKKPDDLLIESIQANDSFTVACIFNLEEEETWTHFQLFSALANATLVSNKKIIEMLTQKLLVRIKSLEKNPVVRNALLKTTLDTLCKGDAGDIDNAFKIIQKMENINYRHILTYGLIKNLLERKDLPDRFDIALNIAKIKLADTLVARLSRALQMISSALSKEGQTERADEIAQIIPNDRIRTATIENNKLNKK